MDRAIMLRTRSILDIYRFFFDFSLHLYIILNVFFMNCLTCGMT